MANTSGINRSFYPFYSPLGPMDISTTPPFSRIVAVKECENVFFLASRSITGWDLVDEFVAANIWPLSKGWELKEIIRKTIPWRTSLFPYPRFALELPEGVNPRLFVDEVERHTIDFLGPCHENELSSACKLVEHELRINRVFEDLGTEVEPCSKPRKASKQMCEAGVTGLKQIGGEARGKRRRLRVQARRP